MAERNVIAVGVSTLPGLLKFDAAKRAVASARFDARVEAVEVRSGVPPQSVGLQQTDEGATRRARAALAALPHARYGLGIENGVVDLGSYWIDLAVVALYDRDRAWAVGRATSVGIRCSGEFVDASLATEQRETAGQHYALQHSCDAADWHAHATGGRLTRGYLLEQAIFAALVQAHVDRAHAEGSRKS